MQRAATGRLFEELRAELGYADYLGALQRYRRFAPARPAHPRRLALPRSRTRSRTGSSRAPSTRSTTARRSARRRSSATATSSSSRARSRAPACYDAVGGQRARLHPQGARARRRRASACPADHYVLVDDKVRILAAVKAAWGSRVTTVCPAARALRARRRRRRALPGAGPHDRADRRSRRAPPRRARRGCGAVRPGTPTSRRGAPARRGGREGKALRR